MQSNFDILTALFQVLNVPAVTGGITGQLMLGDPDLKSQVEDICLKINSKQGEYLQHGEAHIDIYVPTTSTGVHDLTRIRELINLLMPLLIDVTVNTAEGSFYFQVVDDQGVFRDDRRDGMTYYRIIISYQTL